MHRLIGSVFGLCMLCISIAAIAASTTPLVIEVIPVSNRSIDEVIAVVRPLVPPPGSVSIVSNQLVVHSTPERVAQIQRMLGEIDRPPRNLMVTVRYGLRGEAQPHSYSKDSKQTATTAPPTRYSTERVRDSQRVRVVEGHEVFITTGQSVPVASGSRSFFGVGVVAAVPGVEYRDVSSGFYLRPRLSGQQVTLEVFAHRGQRSRWGGDQFEFQEVATLVSGRLGEWIDVGGADTSAALEDDAITYSTRGERSLQNRIFVKVEAVE